MFGGREAANAFCRLAQAGSFGSSKTVVLSMPCASNVSKVDCESSLRLVPKASRGEGKTANCVVIRKDVSKIMITKRTSTVLIIFHQTPFFSSPTSMQKPSPDTKCRQ